MKFTVVAPACALCVYTAHGFVASRPQFARQGIANTIVLGSSPSGDAERMKKILEEEAMNPDNLAASAEQMKNMKPEDMDKIIKEMEEMSPAQKEQLKAMGMNPDMMKRSMDMMKSNPQMMESIGKMMKELTPEQLLQQSRMAQKQMSKMTPEQVEEAAKIATKLPPDAISEVTEVMTKSIKNGSPPGGAADPAVMDSMFAVAELMSQPPTGGVTLQAFSSLPPIALLSGDRDIDLSKKELAECWADGSLGATRVDRQGFERVWNEVREYFEDDIMDEARKTSAGKAKTGGNTAVATEVVSDVSSPSVTPTIGANLTPEQMSVVSEQVKTMSEDDMGSMLSQMESMTPEQEARMKAMGVDPEKMKQTAKMMNDNPLMRKAAAALMKNMTPEQMLKSSREAQEQMAKMSKKE